MYAINPDFDRKQKDRKVFIQIRKKQRLNHCVLINQPIFCRHKQSVTFDTFGLDQKWKNDRIWLERPTNDSCSDQFDSPSITSRRLLISQSTIEWLPLFLTHLQNANAQNPATSNTSMLKATIVMGDHFNLHSSKFICFKLNQYLLLWQDNSFFSLAFPSFLSIN